MITIEKEVTVTIDKADVPVLLDICKIVRHHMVVISIDFSETRAQEIRRFLEIIFEKL